MLNLGSMRFNQSQSSTPGKPTNGSLVLKYFLSETIHNRSRGSHFTKFLISNFLKGLTYSALGRQYLFDCFHHDISMSDILHLGGQII